MTAIAASQPVCVIGSGSMGAGIAQVAAAAGHATFLVDLETERARQAVTNARQRLVRQADKGRMSAEAAHSAADRLDVLDDLASLRKIEGCGLVVEAVVEDLTTKQAVLAKAEDMVDDACLIATNTSSLSVTEIASSLKNPGRCVGMHFFNPAPIMQLVEIVSGLATDPAAAAAASATAADWGKTPVEVRSSPGFLVNRIARPFYAEAFRLAEEHAAEPATVDAVLRQAGQFRMGPFELTDLIGQDVNETVTKTVWRACGRDPRYTPSLAQRALVEAGWLGRKTGRGFYEYGPVAPAAMPSTAEPGPPPSSVVARGDIGPLGQLLDRSGVTVHHTDGPGLVELPSGGALFATDGLPATVHASRLGCPVILVDHALDTSTTTRLALAASDDAPARVLSDATGLLDAAGVAASVIDDAAGLIVGRTVAMLVNEAVDALQRATASAHDIDAAMRLGTNYPLGPLAWGDQWGPDRVLTILDNLAITYGDGRYRACPLLRRRAVTKQPLSADPLPPA